MTLLAVALISFGAGAGTATVVIGLGFKTLARVTLGLRL